AHDHDGPGRDAAARPDGSGRADRAPAEQRGPPLCDDPDHTARSGAARSAGRARPDAPSPAPGGTGAGAAARADLAARPGAGQRLNGVFFREILVITSSVHAWDCTGPTDRRRG